VRVPVEDVIVLLEFMGVLVESLKGHGNEADFLGFCINRFLMSPYTIFRAVPILPSNSRRYL
jgi:hypothetical protein